MINITVTFVCAGPQPEDSDESDSMDLVALIPSARTVLEEELSHRTLVLRRGLALALMLAILLAGIVLNLLLTNLVT